MTARIVIIGSVCLFGAIGFMAWAKKKNNPKPITESVYVPEVKEEKIVEESPPSLAEKAIPETDRIQRLFTLDASKLPIVETISYASRVPWLSGRPAWVTDYASYYHTSRHFIARSLNQSSDYFTQNVRPGDKFNVFVKEKPIQFHLVIDLSQAKMKFYYYDADTDERVFLKSYPVGLGRKEESKTSGYLTPVGTYKLGSRVAVYRPGVMGYFKNKKIEMIQVFGTRWIPFEEEIDGCSEPAKGFGLHGSPWTIEKGNLIEDRTHIGKYDSDGCIRLNAEDVEEIFSIVITKPTYIHITPSFSEANLPGVEKDI